MSRATVRRVIASWIGGAAAPNSPLDPYGNPLIYGQPVTLLPSVGTVYASKPTEENETDYIAGLPSGSTTGAKLIVHLTGPERETREGQKMKRVERRALIQTFCHSVDPNAENGQAIFDVLIEALQTRLRSDPRMGTDGLADPTKKIFNAGESHYGFVTEIAEPMTLPNTNTTELYAQIAFDVTEFYIGF